MQINMLNKHVYFLYNKHCIHILRKSQCIFTAMYVCLYVCHFLYVTKYLLYLSV